MLDQIILAFIKCGIIILSALSLYKIILYVFYNDEYDRFYYLIYYPITNIVFTKDSKKRRIKETQNAISKWLLIYFFIYIFMISSAFYPDTITLAISSFLSDLNNY